jgi:anaerobic magnesium-protoporphyrin IX monomethyl ester cyclase
MVSIGFINPSSDYLHDPFKGDPHTQFHILTILEDHFGDKINSSLIDLRGIEKKFARYHIPECDIYLHSIYTLDINEQKSIVKDLKDRYPMAKHIAGGHHANMFQKDSLEIFDSLILGDGEDGVMRSIEDFMNSDLKRVYKQTSPVDVNNYPVPSRKYLPESTIARPGLLTSRNKKGFDKLLSTTVLFSRGCPYGCFFCDLPNLKDFKRGVRYRHPSFVEEEIEYLKQDYGIRGISLLDEIGIPLKEDNAISHLEAIGKTGIYWRGQCRVDGITPDLAKLTRDSGCISLGLGVESASQISLDIINKKIDVKRSKETIKLLKENDIETRVYMIVGLPGEPRNIVEKTWDFIEETDPELVYLSLFTIRPGTEVYNNPKKFGITNINTDWTKTMHMYGRYDDE